ncbi:autorepressor SdpR family transcription factor [Halalkalibacterium halodurans]|uniref:Transcriptional regulator (ArsR family) n=1 Tax=Halalkalibacterium halodurans (strain ATCC BAA-125 / DSM 18197 / FERM 7344 / JCM 9153 / C-125) TaxID=272558 RepID=Q9KEA8_HALH5|nr:autorepressor SdpR family transcription factor [Halalkalibacterium halodurans]MED4082970.1 autorepressor SdpR family transcription factor [Halalkalibacterium halodurans]MED4086801.1 autorepressor SdpR family transcription factor [Halalkalibacterium halodurans]MED4106263.1 autorepressor SdpR family transcription factor [Halalkalibacterium halodurans]MED4108865.1 autorepressor SdpR family transcription factor [Halalkalibacterium halodurans]MED4125155.1 autorepressor SdpR family transcription 
MDPSIYKALADMNRRKILDLLNEGDKTAGEIADQFDMSKPAISQHLTVLKNAELVHAEKKGQYVYYSLNTSVLQEMVKWLMRFTEKEGRQPTGIEPKKT